MDTAVDVGDACYKVPRDAGMPMSPLASKDERVYIELSPQPKRHLEVQLSEVSDETCDRAAASFLASMDQHWRTAGSPQAKKPKTSPMHACQPAADDGDQAGSVPSTPANASTGPQAPPAAHQAPIGLQQQLIGRISTPMGPPAAPGQLSLGSLLVAAQMASGATAGSSTCPGNSNSPLLLATQATLQATTASVVAAEVLAAVSRPGGISSISTACAGPGVTAAALAGLLAGKLSPAHAPAASPAVLTATAPMQQQQHQLLAVVGEGAAPVVPAAAAAATLQEDQCMAELQQQQQHLQEDAAVSPSASPLVPAPAASATAADLEVVEQPAAIAMDVQSTPVPAAAGAMPAPAKLQLPSWLCEPSPELKASQAICKASLHTATAALARLSSPRGLSLSALAAGICAAGAPPAPASLPAAAFAGQHGVSAAAVPELRGPSLAVSAACAPPAAAAVVVFGIPAREVAAGVGMVWGLPVGASAAAVAASSAAAMLSTQHQAAAAAAAAVDGACMQLPALRTTAAVEDSDMDDAASCSSTPRAATAMVSADRAAEATAARLAAAAVKLAAHSKQLPQQQQHCISGSPVCCSSIALTADDASSPLAVENDVTSGLMSEADADVMDAAAVVVHVAIKCSSKANSAAAAPAADLIQQQQPC